MAVLAGASQYDSPFTLWQEKTSAAPVVDDIDDDLLWFGHAAEQMIADRFTDQHGIATRNVGMYQSKTHPHMFANPDRLTSDGGVLEIKTTERHTANGKLWSQGIVPAAADVQGQHYLAVTGRTHMWFAALVGRQLQIVGPVERDEAMIDWLTTAGAEFWAHVKDNTPPPLGAVVTPDELRARFPEGRDEAEVEGDDQTLQRVERLREIKAEQQELKTEAEEIETQIKATIGDAEFLTSAGARVARWQTTAGRRTFDKQAAVEQIAQLRGTTEKSDLKDITQEFTTQGAPTRRFTLIGGTTK